MKYEVKFDQDLNCIMARIDGEIIKSELKKMAADISELSKKHNCIRLLNDVRNAKLTFLSTTDLYEIPRLLIEWGLPMNLERAVIANKEIVDYHFFETASKNIGQNIRIFTNEDDVNKWLKKE